ncbi:alpha/beta hydrolase [Chitinilyticum litopenaei]|uniref:Alpha/beta hydrolase n=1 Tax=Chitinilyticum piscinae TaxID=2866724 RepID=A0A8J7K112_9NEIS|nr:alpha/beta hydrolase [Chitinilyticum piscinae]
MAAGNRVLLVPGWQGSGPNHWQSRWQQRYPDIERVEQDDWLHPDVTQWGMRLDETIRKSSRPILLVAHSLGCLTVAYWANRYRFSRSRVRAALLVAPADSERSQVPWEGQGFAPRRRERLPFPSLLVASDNDYACTSQVAHTMAQEWGSAFVLLSSVGHINADSGLGDWPYGLGLAGDLLARPMPDCRHAQLAL